MADSHEHDKLVAHLDEVVRIAPVPMLVADREGSFLTANEGWRELFVPRADTTSLERWADHLEPAGRVRVARAVDECVRNGQATALDVEIRHPSDPRWTRLWLHRRLIDGTPVVVFVGLDIHDELVQLDHLRGLATRDELTGLVNRRVFLESVDQALRRVERFGEATGLLYIDLDGFKEVNDQAGHIVGDRVLATVAARLRRAVRGADVVGRIGGDEFAVVLERLTSPAQAEVVARRIEEALGGTIDAGGQTWTISASVGIALTEGSGETAIALLSTADQDMYASKRSRSGADTDQDEMLS